MENEDIVVVIGGLAVLAAIIEPYVTQSVTQIETTFIRLVNWVTSSALILADKLNDWRVYTALITLPIPYLLYKSYISLKKRAIREYEEEKQIEKEEREMKEEEESVRELLKKDLQKLDIEEMEEHIKQMEDKSGSSKIEKGLDELLRETVGEAEILLEDLKEDARVENRRREKKRLGREIKELERVLDEKEEYKKLRKDKVLRRLEENGKWVFKKEYLSKNEVKILLEAGYKQANEYCVCEKKLNTYLIKTEHNHTVTHSFLVWSARQFLEGYRYITNVHGSLTRDADLIFTWKGKNYAIEIETGSLFRKKLQIDEKLKLLNKRYGKRWMFVVSNKNLLAKYRKLGFTTSRKDFEKNLKKLLKQSTRSERVYYSLL